MSCFRIPKSVCEEIEKECANFWWGVENGKRKMHWRCWDFMCKPKSRGGLGFRKMEEFNRSILANQLWRLVKNPASLAAKVLKGRYFRHGDIMNAGIGNNPSFIWRSFIWSRGLLERGLLWRVGNGQSIKIFEDSWVPSLTSKISSPNEAWQQDATVDSLIRNGDWDIDLIMNNFNPFIAGEIIKIPLSDQSSSDSSFWRFDTKGHYSVRDGYRLQRGLFNPPVNQTEYPLHKWWAFIWQLSLPPKVRIFWWRIAHDIIPTNLNLLKHHVPVRDYCSFCHLQPDSTCHSLFFCEGVKHIWKNTDYYRLLKSTKGYCTLDVCCWLSENLSHAEFEKLATITWAVWKEKLEVLHGSKGMINDMNISWANAFLSEYHAARYAVHHPSKSLSTTKKWMKPDQNALKLNVDACINDNLNRYSVGGVLRDNQGRLLMAFGKQIPKPISVLLGELEAIKEGINILYERQFHDVHVTTDSLLAVQAVTNDKSIRMILAMPAYVLQKSELFSCFQ